MQTLFTNQDPLMTINEAHDLAWIETLEGKTMAHQIFFKDMKLGTQCDMLAEFSGKDGKKDKLIDVEKYKKQQESKPLPGQKELIA